MRQRLIVLVVALFLGLIAAFMVNNYVDNAREEMVEAAEPVKILVAVDDLPQGLTLQKLRARKLVETKSIPKEFVAADAIRPSKKLKDKVLAVSVGTGEQLTLSKFKTPTDAGLAVAMPDDDKVAVAVPISSMKSAGDLVKIGDLVNVVATVKVDTGTVTKTILQNIKVLALNSELDEEEPQSGQGSTSGLSSGRSSSTNRDRTITLAMTQAEAEKLIYVQEEGRLWLTLLPTSEEKKEVTTEGQWTETILQ